MSIIHHQRLTLVYHNDNESAQNMVLGVAFFMTVFPVQPSLLVKQKCAALKARPEIDKIRIVLDLDLRVGGPKYLLLKRVSRAL